MKGLATLKYLRKSKTTATVLRKGSHNTKAIVALQSLLHELGFDGPLQWETYGADGDYGDCTRRAVLAFGRQAGVRTQAIKEGKWVTPELADALIRISETIVYYQMPGTGSSSKNRVALGGRELERGATGPDVEELQLRLSGFRGTVWDGHYGPGTELQVRAFQRDVMGIPDPSGVADLSTLKKLRQFAKSYPVNFRKLRCPCEDCPGFGQRRFSQVYREGKPQTEAFHHREYPGIHKAIIHAVRAARCYAGQTEEPSLLVTSGYRCWVHNETKGRRSTNHMGKAIDCDFTLQAGEDKRDDHRRCDRFRGVLVEKGNFQLGWTAPNRKSLEPSRIAPTWIHLDVRQYAPPVFGRSIFCDLLSRVGCF